MTLTEWLLAHIACDEGQEWAADLTPREAWDTAPPEYLVWAATQPGVLDDRTLRRFACWCVRQVWHLLTDERSRTAVEAAEQYAEGQVTDIELAAARAAASAASAASAAASDAQATWLRTHASPNWRLLEDPSCDT